jgi:hypothetical protein
MHWDAVAVWGLRLARSADEDRENKKMNDQEAFSASERGPANA